MSNINKLIVKIRKETNKTAYEIKELAKKKLNTNIDLSTVPRKSNPLILTKEEEKIKHNLEESKQLMEKYLNEYDYTERGKKILEDKLKKLLDKLKT